MLASGAYLRSSFFFLECYGDQQDLHSRPRSCPTRRSSDLVDGRVAVEVRLAVAAGRVLLVERFAELALHLIGCRARRLAVSAHAPTLGDRKSTRMNSSH